MQGEVVYFGFYEMFCRGCFDQWLLVGVVQGYCILFLSILVFSFRFFLFGRFGQWCFIVLISVVEFLVLGSLVFRVFRQLWVKCMLFRFFGFLLVKWLGIMCCGCSVLIWLSIVIQVWCEVWVWVLVVQMCELDFISMLLIIVFSDGIYSIVWFGFGFFRLIIFRVWFFSFNWLFFSGFGIISDVGVLFLRIGFQQVSLVFLVVWMCVMVCVVVRIFVLGKVVFSMLRLKQKFGLLWLMQIVLRVLLLVWICLISCLVLVWENCVLISIVLCWFISSFEDMVKIVFLLGLQIFSCSGLVLVVKMLVVFSRVVVVNRE